MKYIRNVLVAVLLLALALPSVALAAGSYTAYISKKTYVYKKASTASTRKSVAANTQVVVTGKSGKFYKVKKTGGSVTGYVLKNCVTTKVPASIAWKSKVIKKDWFKGGSGILKRNGYGYIYDIDTGIYMRLKRMGGTNHADVEPATAADTKKLLKIAGGRFSWASHAVILYAGGKYVACAINTMPHGEQTIANNNFNGQFCLHMTNSTTHGTTAVNVNHQASIERAYQWAH